MQQVIDRYALALLKLTPDSNLQTVNNDIAKINNLFVAQPSIYNFLTSKVTHIVDAQSAVKIIVAQLGLQQLIENFLNVLIINQRIQLFEKIIHQFNNLVDRQNSVIKADIITACSLDDRDRIQLEQNLADKFGDNIVYRHRFDAQLLNGFIIKIGSQTLDCSLKSKLLQLQQYLLKT